MEKDKIEYPPNHAEIIGFLAAKRICYTCGIVFTFGTSIGKIECNRHQGVKIYASHLNRDEYRFKCCKGDEISIGCQQCDHSDKKIKFNMVEIAQYYIQHGHVKPKISNVVTKTVVTINRKNNEGSTVMKSKEEPDLFNTIFNIKRVKD